jgi:inorganic triphosphatase YgiF
MANEIELKLTIDQQYASRLSKHPVITNKSASKPSSHKLTSIYFDSPDLKLIGTGVTLRVSHTSSGWIQTIQLSGSSCIGLHQHLEWHCPIASNHPDFTKIVEPILVRIFPNHTLRRSIIPIFKTEIHRTSWQLAFNNGDQVEVAFDLGRLIVNDKEEVISEIKLKLKSGNVGRLFDLALELQDAIPLNIENLTQAQRGYAHYRDSPPQVIKAQLPTLTRKMNANIAFKEIVWECINQLQLNLNVVLHTSDIEGVHQMRIALRRLRSAFILFKLILGHKKCAFILSELKWLSDILGKARDIDVLLTQTIPSITDQFKHHQGLLTLQQLALQRQLAVYDFIRQALLSQRYNCLLLTICSWLENEKWKETKKHYKLLTVATRTLNKFHKQLLRHNDNLTDMSPEYMHATRIASKRLRYLAEFFTSLYPTKDCTKFIKILAQVQECLGQINDITVAERLLDDLNGPQPDTQSTEAIQCFKQWNASLATHNIAKINPIWKQLTSMKPFWL